MAWISIDFFGPTCYQPMAYNFLVLGNTILLKTLYMFFFLISNSVVWGDSNSVWQTANSNILVVCTQILCANLLGHGTTEGTCVKLWMIWIFHEVFNLWDNYMTCPHLVLVDYMWCLANPNRVRNNVYLMLLESKHLQSSHISP